MSVNIQHLSPKYVCILVLNKHIECIHFLHTSRFVEWANSSQCSSFLPLLAHWCVSVHQWIALEAPYITSPACTCMCIQHAHERGKEMGTHLFPSRLDGAVRQTSCYLWDHFFSWSFLLCQRCVKSAASAYGKQWWKLENLLLATMHGANLLLGRYHSGFKEVNRRTKDKS